MASHEQAVLAVATPKSPYGRTFELGILWSSILRGEGYNTVTLPFDHGQEGFGFELATEERLKQAGGLVIAAFNVRNIPLDEANITQIELAKELELPVFMQLSLEEAELPERSTLGTATETVLRGAELIVIGGDYQRISERLPAASSRVLTGSSVTYTPERSAALRASAAEYHRSRAQEQAAV